MERLKKLSKKGFTILLVTFMVVTMYLPIATEEASAATISVTNQGRMFGYYADGSTYEYNAHCYFTTSGYPAFCGRHAKTPPVSPGSTKSLTTYEVSNTLLLKVLYYGYGGPGQWSGFASSTYNKVYDGTGAATSKTHACGNIVTSMATHYAVRGATEFFYKPSGYDAFMKYVNSQPTPVGFTTYRIDGNSGTQPLFMLKSVPVGKLTLLKSSANEGITNDNPCYSLEGAVYTVYKNSNLTGVVGTLITDANGQSNVIGSLSGTYYVKETTAPLGYAMDEKVYTVNINSSHQTNPYVLNVTDRPEADPIAMLVNKVDADTGAPVPTGNGTSLGGAQFTVKFYYGIDWTEDPALSGEEPIRIWIFETDESGYCSYGEKWFVSGDEFWYDELKTATLPLGTITVQETKAPTGYLINEEIFVMKTTGTGLVSVDNQPLDAALVNEQVKKGDIEFIKIDSETEEPLEGVVFEIIDAVTGEVVKTITTDKNGYATTAEEDKPEGTIPYGKYFIHETAPLKGYHALEEDVEVSITENGQTTEGLVIENDPKLGLIVMDDNIKLFGKDGMVEFITGDNMRNVVSVAAILMLLAVFGIIYIVRKNKKETDVN